MPHEGLVSYLRTNRERFSDELLRKTVLDAGWERADVDAAFAALGERMPKAIVAPPLPSSDAPHAEKKSFELFTFFKPKEQPKPTPSVAAPTQAAVQPQPVTLKIATIPVGKPTFVAPAHPAESPVDVIKRPLPNLVARTAALIEALVILITVALVVLAILLVWSDMMPDAISRAVEQLIAALLNEQTY